MTNNHTVKFLDRNPPLFSLAEAERAAATLFALAGSLAPLGSERDQNFHLQTAVGSGYVLKFSNAAEDPGVVDFQSQALRHVAQQDPELLLPRVVPTLAGEPFTTVMAEDGTPHLVRMLTYLPGNILGQGEKPPALWHELGQFLGRLDLALRGFFHPHARHELLWDVTRCPSLHPHAVYIADAAARASVERIFDRMATAVLPQLSKLRHQVIHADAHRENMLVSADNPHQLAGLLDFGDMVYAPLVLEIAIAADVKGLSPEKQLDKLCAVAAGYDTIIPLEEAEIDLIYELVLARLALTATIVAWRKVMTPDQPAYLQAAEPLFWQTIAHLEQVGLAHVRDRLRRACRFPTYCPTTPAEAGLDNTEALLARRYRVLGKHLSFFYSRPVHVERGRGPWLYGTDGQAYLDAYNNVPVVGHCHPHVVKAIARQTAVLNTNTRYLYRSILDYAERLVATLPGHLTVCAFVNSGSEANDIAWRMAKFITGNDGAIVMENAYHGITEAIKALSPSGGTSLVPHVQTLLSPNPYRGPYRYGEPDLAERYAADTDRALVDLAAAGHKPAVFMVDSLFVSNGSPDVPMGYLTAVAAKVRAAGGLIVADEVQAGFGRSGSHWWGHQLHGLEADIVTMGKPVGSGYPIGIIVTTPEILNAFVGKVGLFSTFGGNPVACAAGTAVLDVIEWEGLMVNAQETGGYLRAGLRQLMNHHALIGDVRGRGLLTGVDLVRDRTSRAPATAETRRVLDLMRDNGVLIGKGDVGGNVLKIRPPLVFRREQADLLIAALDRSLAALA